MVREFEGGTVIRLDAGRRCLKNRVEKSSARVGRDWNQIFNTSSHRLRNFSQVYAGQASRMNQFVVRFN